MNTTTNNTIPPGTPGENTNTKAPFDLDAPMTAKEFVRWIGGGKTERWAIVLAKKKKIPAHKAGRDWIFYPRTFLAGTLNIK